MTTIRSTEMVEIGLKKAEKYMVDLNEILSLPRLQCLAQYLPDMSKNNQEEIVISDDL